MKVKVPGRADKPPMIVKSLLSSSFLALALAVPATAQEIEWGYEGDRGPANWGSLAPAFSTGSTGERQSPINLRGADRVDAARIRAKYTAAV